MKLHAPTRAVADLVYDEKVQAALEAAVKRYLRKYGGNPEDILSAAHAYYLKAYEQYKPERGPYDVWVRQRIWYGLTEELRKEIMRHHRIPRTFFENYDVLQSQREFDPDTLLARLSPDACEAVLRVLNVPGDMKLALNEMAEETPRAIGLAVKSCLRELGWSVGRIASAFREVSEAL